MSGHSKWATTKNKKAAIDAKRGKLFAKLIKNIEIAARTGGGDPNGNPTLYDAIVKAKKSSVPADNITRAVKRGSGEEAGGANYEEIVYEGYAPRRHRPDHPVPDRQPEPGCRRRALHPVQERRVFGRKRFRQLQLPPSRSDRSPGQRRGLRLPLRDRGRGRGHDVEDKGDFYLVTTDPSTVVDVRKAIQDAGFDYDSAETTLVPLNSVELDLEGAKKVTRLIDALDDLDDVQDISAAWTASDEVMQQLEEDE